MHRRFGEGEMFSFNPYLHMVIVFQQIGYMVISTTKEHMAEITVEGRQLTELLDVKDPSWYPGHWLCRADELTHYN